MKHARRDYDRIQDPSGKIPADEPVFLVRAQDMSAPATLRFWAAENQKNGGDEDLTALVDDWAIRMEEWQQQHGKKPADLGPMAASTEQPAAPAFIKDNVIAETVNHIRDTALLYRDTQQLRDNIGHIIVPLLASANSQVEFYRQNMNYWERRAKAKVDQEDQAGIASPATLNSMESDT